MMKIDILSDPICPWCFIGWTYLTRALAARPNHPFEIEWHPFQLNPDMSPKGMDRRAYLEAKFGGREGAAQAYAPIIDHAKDAGLTLNLDAITRTPNTLDAHRVLHWAGFEHRQTPMKEALFKAYFQEGRDIGNPMVLVDLAEDVKLDRTMIEKLLSGDTDAQDIRARDAHARARGVTGVPTFIIGGQHVLRGARPTNLWINIIDDITAQTPATA